jgi:hypothetical protein
LWENVCLIVDLAQEYKHCAHNHSLHSALYFIALRRIGVSNGLVWIEPYCDNVFVMSLVEGELAATIQVDSQALVGRHHNNVRKFATLVVQ